MNFYNVSNWAFDEKSKLSNIVQVWHAWRTIHYGNPEMPVKIEAENKLEISNWI
jgi:hypothetical protein